MTCSEGPLPVPRTLGQDRPRGLPNVRQRITFTALRGTALRDTGRSAARLARLLREQEVRGSNPRAPMTHENADAHRVGVRRFRRLARPAWATPRTAQPVVTRGGPVDGHRRT